MIVNQLKGCPHNAQSSTAILVEKFMTSFYIILGNWEKEKSYSIIYKSHGYCYNIIRTLIKGH